MRSLKVIVESCCEKEDRSNSMSERPGSAAKEAFSDLYSDREGRTRMAGDGDSGEERGAGRAAKGPEVREMNRVSNGAEFKSRPEGER